VTPETDTVPVGEAMVFSDRMWSLGIAVRAEDHTVCYVADRAGHPLLLKSRIKVRIGFENGIEFFTVPKSEHQILLLVLQRNVAVHADLLGAVKNRIDLKVGVGPGMGMDAARPLFIDLSVTAPALFRAQGFKTWRDGSDLDGPLKIFGYNKDTERPHKAVDHENDEESRQSKPNDSFMHLFPS